MVGKKIDDEQLNYRYT